MNAVEINILVLAYLGDVIYENYVRHYLVKQGISHVENLQKEAIKYVSAKAQASFLQKLVQEEFFTTEEMDVIKRARNYRGCRHPKNCDIVTYKHATALEALLGYLDVNNNENRINCIMNTILGGNLC